MVGDPGADAVGPDVVGATVRGVEGVFGEQFAACEIVRKQGVAAVVEHPHRGAVGPDAASVAVALGEFELTVRDAFAALQVVGEGALTAAV